MALKGPTTSIAAVPIRTPMYDEENRLSRVWTIFFGSLSGGPQSLSGTHAERLKFNPASVPEGSTYYEEDRGVYYVAVGQMWRYLQGTMRDTLANKPTGLSANDAGFLFFATDYAHTWRWDGAAWAYAPGDRASGEFSFFAAAPGTGWALCDGSTVTRSTATATTASIALPDLIGKYAKGASSYSNAGVSAANPSITGDTGAGTAHSHGAGSISTVATATPSVLVTTGASGTYVTTATHTHTMAGGSTDSESSHTHAAGTLAVTGGEPAHVDLLPYFRL